jgi:dihydropteroate synthase-like protein
LVIGSQISFIDDILTTDALTEGIAYMKILLVTGRLAESVVFESASQQNVVDFSVRALPISVAALLTPEYISNELKDEDLSGYDLVVVPGMVRGDTSIIEKAVGVPVFKGTKYASDLPVLLEALGGIDLSRVVAADTILAKHLRDKTIAILQNAEKPDRSVAEKPWNMVIGENTGKRLFVGRDFPMRVIAEILDAPSLGNEEVLKKAIYYVESGAQIIDVGMLAGEPRPDDARRIVALLRDKLRVPISIDSLNLEDIEAGVRSGADMVLSLNSSNLEKINCDYKMSDVAVVVIPDRKESIRQTTSDESVRDRVASLEKNIEKASQLGFKKIIADLIMDPLVSPGIISSLVATRIFSGKQSNIPLIFGVGNVTELIDADSTGVNATVAGIAQELNAALLLTTEGSTKTRGAVRELATASSIMYLAKRRDSPPKDLGIDLLRLKEKRRRDVPYDRSLEKDENITKLEAKRGGEPVADKKGYFKISLDQDGGKIVVSHFKGERGELDIVVKGSEPTEVRDTLIRLGLLSTLEHAYYLGMEIEKAYIGSQINRSYYQDEELFVLDSHQ